jgi:hypothetical protein
MADQKLSLLINRQVPEFVREEHPKFISFLEAYYEFLDTTLNDKVRGLKTFADVDQSLSDFENQFFNSFLPFVPRDTALSKEKLIKNFLPVFLSKGSEKSFQLLFRMLFDEDALLTYPKERILRASDGKWNLQSYLRIETEVHSDYISDGSRTEYYLPYIFEKENFQVYINGNFSTDFIYRKEQNEIVLNQTPSLNSTISIRYLNFDISKIFNVKVTGLNSKAFAIVEKSSVRNIGTSNFFQFSINRNTLSGNFENGEVLLINYPMNGTIIPLYFQSFSDVGGIEITNPGSYYSVGDTVVFLGEAKVPAFAVVSKVTSGVIDELSIFNRGSGFKVGNKILVNGYIESFFSGQVLTVDESGANTINSISYNSDIISDYLSVTLDSADYGFPAAGTENLSSTIISSLSYQTISNIGPITSTNVVSSQISSNVVVEFTVESSNVTNQLKISDLGSVGKITIVESGENYEVGDQLIFGDISFSGSGASGYVSDVGANGEIMTVRLTDGGLQYDPSLLSSIIITIDSANGSNAQLVVENLLGQGYDLDPITNDGIPGKIQEIKIINSGVGYLITPTISLEFSGDGTATAVANIRTSFIELSGKWSTSDGIISSDEIRLQGNDYYIDYSYVISSQIEFNKYKNLLKNILHPSGYKNYAVFTLLENVDSGSSFTVDTDLQLTLSGNVSVTNGSTMIVGSNTNFLSANANGIISIGTGIVVNNEIRTISSVDTETTMNVTTAFTSNSSNQLIKIVV